MYLKILISQTYIIYFLKDIVEILYNNLDQVPVRQKRAINFNVGGFDKHRIFWYNNIKPNGGGESIVGTLDYAINTSVGNFTTFKVIGQKV